MIKVMKSPPKQNKKVSNLKVYAHFMSITKFEKNEKHRKVKKLVKYKWIKVRNHITK